MLGAMSPAPTDAADCGSAAAARLLVHRIDDAAAAAAMHDQAPQSSGAAMNRRLLAFPCALALFAGCSSPYRPAVVVHGGASFRGVAGIIHESGNVPVDVVLVHGMCTTTSKWAYDAIDSLSRAIDANVPTAARPPEPVAPTGIQTITEQKDIGGGTVRFSALIWSPLTTPFKRQLDYDITLQPTDCSADGECRPVRAKLNGYFKDNLFDDCLSDVMIYQGQSRDTMRDQMIQAITRILEQSQERANQAGAQPGPLVLVTQSLGSKMTFDALAQMLRDAAPQVRSAGVSAMDRLAVIFMEANQLPILGLADQVVRSPGAAVDDAKPAPIPGSLVQILRFKSQREQILSDRAKMDLVAFTDPNDLLSYRLQPSLYNVPGIDVADVLVSNDSTYFGLLESPMTHSHYPGNPDVARLIACGWPESPVCR
jgi:hypothetical protein